MSGKNRLLKLKMMSGIALSACVSLLVPSVIAAADDTDVTGLSRAGDCPFILPNQDQTVAKKAIAQCRKNLMNAMLGVQSQAPGEALEKKIDDIGARFLNAGRYGLAADHYLKKYQRNRQDIEAMNGLAISYDKIGRFDLSRRFYREALRARPDDPVALNNFGYSLLLQKRPHEAQILLDKASALLDNEATQRNLRIAVEANTATERDVSAPPSPLLVRVSHNVQKLIVTPDLEFLKSASKVDVDPRMAARIDSGVRAPIIRIVTRPAKRVAVAAPKNPVIQSDYKPTLEVSNGAGVQGMAARMRAYLKRVSYGVNYLTNAQHFEFQKSTLFYAPGHREAAEAFVKELPIIVHLQESRQLHTDLKLRLGHDAQLFDTQLKKHAMLDTQDI